MRAYCRCAVVLLLCVSATGLAGAAERDPWLGFNRKIFAFNEVADRWVLKPLASGYRAVVPDRIERHVANVFANFMDVVSAGNHALQGEGRYAADTAGRVVANTLLGIGGVFDVASAGGIPRRPSNFGTTLGKWGVGSGPYLVLPFLGPSTVRDASALPVDFAIHPIAKPWTVIAHDETRLAVVFVDAVDSRARLLNYEPAVIGDRYTFIRDVYLQQRDASIHGASAVDPFLEDDFDQEQAPEQEDDKVWVE